MAKVNCPYCSQAAKLVNGNAIYPFKPDVWNRKFYHCKPCDAYVGTHGGTAIPLGTLANAELRSERNKAHAAFDPHWQTGGLSRKEAYRYLASLIGMEVRSCHIAMMNVDQCKKVVEVCKPEVWFSTYSAT